MSTPESDGPNLDPSQTGGNQQEARNRRTVPEVMRDFLGKFRRNKTKPRREHQEPIHKPTQPFQRPEQPEQQEQQPPPAPNKENAREKESLANERTASLPVLPGKRWAMHYPNGPTSRSEAVQRLFDGDSTPDDEIDNVTPDALIYNTNDIANRGYEAVQERIRDTVTAHENYGFDKLTAFVAEMQGAPITADHAQSLYNTIARDRIQQIMLSTYGSSDRARIAQALQAEAGAIETTVGNAQGIDKILAAAKSDTLIRKQMGSTAIHEAAVSSLTPDEKAVYDALVDDYRDYISRGNPDGYNGIVDTIKTYYGQQPPQSAETSTPPPTPNEDEFQEPIPETDKYPPPKEGSEAEPSTPKRFEITPAGTSTEPMLGYYPRKHENVYDFLTHDWATPSNVIAYAETITGDERQNVTGLFADFEQTIQVPSGHALDLSSLTFTGETPTIGRDQFGNFKILGKGPGKFSVDFLKEEPPFQLGPEEKDLEVIHRGQLSAEATTHIQNLKGTDIEKAEAIKEFLMKRHQYPEADEIQTIQSNLRSKSTTDNYIQNLEQSDKLECYSANTLYVAMLREAGITSRLVLGDYIDTADDGKVIIDGSTPHAWVNVWDGTEWITIDATPAKQHAGQDEDAGDPGDSGDEETKPSPQSGQNGMEEFFPSDAAEDREMAEGNEALASAHEAVQQANQRREALFNSLRNAEGFEEMQQLMEEIAADEALFDDMKEPLDASANAKERQMKQELEEKIAQMAEEGFMDEAQARALLKKMEDADAQGLDDIKNTMDIDGTTYEEFRKIQAEVKPFVDNAYRNLVRVLPRFDTVEQDRKALTDDGELDMEAVMDPDSYIRGDIFRPMTRQPQIRPKILMKFLVDTSGSAEGDIISMEQKLLVAYSELASRVENDYGYIRFSIDAFSNDVRSIKGFDQSYSDKSKHRWDDGSEASLKVRMMNAMKASGGTNILEAVRNASGDLHQELEKYKNYVTAVQYIGDGGDTYGNYANIQEYMNLTDSDDPDIGFGNHLFSATMLGTEDQRSQLAELFRNRRTGDDRTTVASNFPELFQQSVVKFSNAVKSLRIR
jgi:hypothetical protein